MRKHTPGRLLAYGLSVVAVAALAIAGAASGNHWADYNGTANSHELKAGNPDLCPATAGGVSFRVDASALTEGGEVVGALTADALEPDLRILLA